jgi:hypothetical protein
MRLLGRWLTEVRPGGECRCFRWNEGNKKPWGLLQGSFRFSPFVWLLATN